MQGGPASAREPLAGGAHAARETANGVLGDLQARIRASSGKEILLPQELGPISPELILVSPPEIARLARDLLPDLPRSYHGLGRAELVPLPAPRLAVFEEVPARGIMDASVEPAYALREVVRGTLALAVAAALFAAAALAADRAVERPGGGASARPTLTAPTPPRSGVAGVSISRSVGVAEGGAGRVPARRAPATHTRLRPAKKSAAGKTAQGKAPQQIVVATGSGGSAPGATPAHPQAKSGRKAPARAADAASRGTFVPSRVFAWASAPGARAYEVRFLLDGEPVLALRPSRPRLTLPESFRFRAGVYRWQVTPLLATGGRGAPLVDSSFRLTAASAASANRAAG